MSDYRGFRVPEDLHYDLGYHVWLRVEGDLVAVGATDPAQAYAGEIIHMGIKKAGTRVERGGILATIESAKFMGPMRSPVSGTVSAVTGDRIGPMNFALSMVARIPPRSTRVPAFLIPM